jgi:competence protein ComEA
MAPMTRGQTLGIVALLAVVTGWVGVTALRNGQPSSAPGIVVRESLPTGGPTAGPAVSGSPGQIPAAPVQALESGTAPAEIVVHVAGAVKRPGVYHLRPNARNTDAVQAAGGFAALANTDVVNLAAHSEDGSQLYIPTRAEQPSGGSNSVVHASASQAAAPRTTVASPGAKSATSTGSGSHPGKLSDPAQGQIDLNTADSGQLQRIPGVGPAMAEHILTYRRTAGRFRSVDELLQIPGIGDKKFQKMRAFMVVH